MSVLRFKGHTYVNVISNASNNYYKAIGHANQHQGTCQITSRDMPNNINDRFM